MRLEVESDIAVAAIVHELADAIDAVRDRRVDVLNAIGRARLILLSPNVNKHRRWACQRRAVVSSLDRPDRLLEVIRYRS
jgi:hypothetical protein